MLRALFDRAKGVDALLRREERPRSTDRISRAKRARRAQQAEAVPRTPSSSELRNRMLEPLDIRRCVARELRRPQEWHLGAVLPRDVGDVFRVGRDNHRLEHAALASGSDRIGKHRMPTEHPDVLASHTLGTAASGNQRDTRTLQFHVPSSGFRVRVPRSGSPFAVQHVPSSCDVDRRSPGTSNPEP